MPAEDLNAELRACLEAWEIANAATLSEYASLIESGAMDSLALFNLAAWIEEKTGRDINPTAINLPDQWDTIARIIQFVSDSRESAPSMPLSPAHRAIERAPSVKITRYMAQHAEQVAQLQKRLWSADAAMNLRYLHWKYFDNPYYDGEANIYLAFDGDELVGMRGFYPSRWQCGVDQNIVEILIADDQTLLDDGRRDGVIAQIMQHAISDLRSRGRDYLFNLTGGPKTVLGSLVMGWRSAGNWQPWARQSRRWKRDLGEQFLRLPGAWRFADKVVAAHSNRAPFSALDRRTGSRLSVRNIAISVSKEPRPYDMAALIARLPHDGRIRHLRDEAFLEWKFRNPLHDYRFLFASDAQLNGYLVLHRFTHTAATSRVSIVDLEADDEITRNALLDAAIKFGNFSDLAIWTATLDPLLQLALQVRGFQPTDQHLTTQGCPCVLVRAIDESQQAPSWSLGSANLLDLANWDLRRVSTMAG